MEEIQTLNQIAYEYFKRSSFELMNHEAKMIVINIQRNQILQSQLELKQSQTTSIDDSIKELNKTFSRLIADDDFD